MQDLLEWIRRTLPMDLDTPRMIEDKIESLLHRERKQIINAWNDGYEKGLRTREENISNPAFDAETYYANNYDTTKGLPEEDSKRRAWHY